MPPVLGPVSPSPTRLKSCAGWNASTVVPSLTANRLTSGPSRYSSTSTRPQRAAWSTAACQSSVTSTPLPAARPSSLTTYGGPNVSRRPPPGPGHRTPRSRRWGRRRQPSPPWRRPCCLRSWLQPQTARSRQFRPRAQRRPLRRPGVLPARSRRGRRPDGSPARRQRLQSWGPRGGSCRSPPFPGCRAPRRCSTPTGPC